MQTRVNGRAIEDYKRFEVREIGLAVPEAESLYRPAISNGYTPNNFIVDDSLVLYLPLYLLKGSKFKSVDRYQHACTVADALWKPDGRDFNGTSAIITVAHHAALTLTTTGTIEAWFKWDGTAAKIFALSKGNSTTKQLNNYIITDDSNTRIDFLIGDGTGVVGPVNVTGWASIWTQMVFTWDGSYLYVYRNKVLIAGPTSQTRNGVGVAFDLTIGYSPYALAYFKGVLSILRIYNRGFNQAKVTHNYNCTIGRY